MSEPELTQAAAEVAPEAKEVAIPSPTMEDLGDGYTLVVSSNGALTVVYKHGGLDIARAIDDRKGIKDAMRSIEARVERMRRGFKPNTVTPPAETVEGDGVAGE